jgi:ADP-ribosylglycohydrolase
MEESGQADRRAMGDSLRGLALGDGFGGRWFHQGGGQRVVEMIEHRHTPTEAPFHYSDDTAMALSIARVLATRGRIDQQALAELFAAEFMSDPYRQYGYGMTRLLPRLDEDPGNFATYAKALFNGEGSLGNGSAMRVAPLGAYFHRDLDRVVEQAALSSEVTHAHPEAVAGAVAVAVAAALSAAGRDAPPRAAGDVLAAVAELTPSGPIRDGVAAAAGLDPSTEPGQASDILGSGQRIRASDTVPFSLWVAARHPDDFAAGLWAAAAGLGDVDTTCAITGGIIAARTGTGRAPQAWLGLREPLPDWAEAL